MRFDCIFAVGLSSNWREVCNAVFIRNTVRIVRTMTSGKVRRFN